MHYTSNLMGLGSLASAPLLPTGNPAWLVARVLLDTAGGLFLLYLLALCVLTLLAVAVPRSREERAELRQRRQFLELAPRR